MGVTKQEVFYIVENNDKKRYATEKRNGVDYIRCNQGHSASLVKSFSSNLADSELGT